MLLLLYIGTSCKLNNFLNHYLLAANYFSSSTGKVRTTIVKNIKKSNLIIFPVQKKQVQGAASVLVQLAMTSGYSSTSLSTLPNPFQLPPEMLVPSERGLKKSVMQHIHITRATENMLIFPAEELEPSQAFLSKTKLMSDYLSLALFPFEASLSTIELLKNSSY